VRADRALLDVLTDILGNLEDIVRSELRLAKAELTDELRSAKSSVLGLGIAILASTLTFLFLLLSAMYALRLLLAPWGAALVVAAATALVSVVAFAISARHMRARRNIRPTTAASVKENLQWARRSGK
jgi:uncharacterized membrane protein YqjE